MPTVVFANSRDRHIYAVIQTGGVLAMNAATTGAKYIRFEELSITMDRPLTEPTYKTGTRSPLIGIFGRSGNSRFTLRMPVMPSGAAGTAPDIDPILQNIYGAAPTISAGVSVTYNLSDALLPMSIYHFDVTPGIANPNSFYILGGMVETATFALNGNQLELTIEGRCIGIGHKSLFASYTGVDAVLKGGLSAFPTEPGSFTTAGNMQPGFGGTGTFAGTAVAELRGSPRVVISSGVDYLSDAFNSYYPVAIQGGLRTVSLSGATFGYSDSTILQTLLADTFTKTAVTTTLALTPSAGNNTSFSMGTAFQLGVADFKENGAFIDMNIPDSKAHASAAGLSDDHSLIFT